MRNVGLERDRQGRLRIRSAGQTEARLNEAPADANHLRGPHRRLAHHISHLAWRDFERTELLAQLGEQLAKLWPVMPHDGPVRRQEANTLVANFGGEPRRVDLSQIERGQAG